MIFGDFCIFFVLYHVVYPRVSTNIRVSTDESRIFIEKDIHRYKNIVTDIHAGVTRTV